MSFLKNLFEKRKDSKYGKGHKLGDKSTQQQNDLLIQQQQQTLAEQRAFRPQTSIQSDAARAAGEAALSRLEKSN